MTAAIGLVLEVGGAFWLRLLFGCAIVEMAVGTEGKES